MALIEISDLNAAGSDLFAGSDSFLNELKITDTNQIFGGTYGYGYKKYEYKKYDYEEYYCYDGYDYKKYDSKKYDYKKYDYKKYDYKKGYDC
jgi:hypothetical protein